MQFICRFIDPKIQILSVEVGRIDDGQFKPVDSVKDILYSFAPNVADLVRFDDLVGTQAYIKFSEFDDFFQDLVQDVVIENIESDLPLSFEDIMKYVKLSFYPMMIVIDIDETFFKNENYEESEKEKQS